MLFCLLKRLNVRLIYQAVKNPSDLGPHTTRTRCPVIINTRRELWLSRLTTRRYFDSIYNYKAGCGDFRIYPRTRYSVRCNTTGAEFSTSTNSPSEIEAGPSYMTAKGVLFRFCKHVLLFSYLSLPPLTSENNAFAVVTMF